LGRRDSDDEKWLEVKEAVRKRDGGKCRLLKVISAKEALILKKKAGYKINQIDSAHFLPVSERPDLCYEINNICLLNRYSHEMLDSFRDPITGAHISKEKTFEWWLRILATNKRQLQYLIDNQIISAEEAISL